MEKRSELKSAVPTFLVQDVGATARWYAEHLGFVTAGTFPPEEPYGYASLQQDGAEIMLLRLPGYDKPDLTARRPEGLWDAYLRVDGVDALYDSVRGRPFVVSPLAKQSYGDVEFTIRDPNGYLLVFGGTETGAGGVPVHSFRFDWDAREHARIVDILTRSAYERGPRRVLKWVAYVVLGLGLVFSAILAIDGRRGAAIGLAAWLIGFLLWLAMFGRLAGWLQARRIARTDPAVKAPLTRTLDRTGIRATGGTTRLEIKWSGVRRVRETDTMFLFFIGPLSAQYLPKRVVGDRAAVDALREWIRDRLAPGVPYEVG